MRRAWKGMKMKCPHCNYEDYSIDKNGKYKEGVEGRFYRLPISMERQSYYGEKDRREVYGCPACHKIFMETF